MKAFRFLFIVSLLVIALTGCEVEETPTPEVVDPTGFVTYIHPTGVFSISMPPNWVVNDRSDEYALNVEFSSPGSESPLIGVYVVSSGSIAEGEAATGSDSEMLNTAITDYQSIFYINNEAIFKEIARDPQADGSTRITFLIDAPQGTSQHNDFVYLLGNYFAALRVRIPEDPTQHRTLTRIIDTFSLNQEAEWQSAADMATGGGKQDAVGFANLNAWTDRNAGFVIVGQVVDNANLPLEFVRITARLYDIENNLLAEQDDFVSSDMILPGEYTPFSIVFGSGLPPGTVRYDLNASARYANLQLRSFYGGENFTVSSQADFNENGFLVISGQVRNEGSATANLIKVIVTIFDADQRVIGTDTTLVDQQRLAPGESSGFAVTFVEVGGVPNTFLVTAQGITD